MNSSSLVLYLWVLWHSQIESELCLLFKWGVMRARHCLVSDVQRDLGHGIRVKEFRNPVYCRGLLWVPNKEPGFEDEEYKNSFLNQLTRMSETICFLHQLSFFGLVSNKSPATVFSWMPSLCQMLCLDYCCISQHTVEESPSLHPGEEARTQSR